MISHLNLAIKAARKAGKIHKKYFGCKGGIKIKSSSFDLVTRADIEGERAVVSLIKKYFPQHNFIAEEEKYARTDSEYTWIIDPLDGTNNFSCGLPIFCVSIALTKGNETILGVVYDVMRNELFYAEKGRGAFLNRESIKVNSADSFEKSLLITGFYYNRAESMVETLGNIKEFFFKRILGLRRFGAAALDLCNVACGRAAGFWEFELSPWDFAAGRLIVEEAGGKVTGRHGEEIDTQKKSYIVASNRKIHEKILEVLK
ncbi:MAG: inositol monophosphatase family protein [Candidatus Gorgyraea atricola]|nr:inositol monophosphatase family protein [Candidatus Gorgyraea atricola]